VLFRKKYQKNVPEEISKECSENKLNELQKLIKEGKAKQATKEMSKLGIEKFKPLFAEVLYTAVLKFMNNNDRGGILEMNNNDRGGILENNWVWTRDISSDGYRVIIGYFDSDGFNVFRYLDGHHCSNLVLVSSWSLN
jgi:hypothetical protein